MHALMLELLHSEAADTQNIVVVVIVIVVVAVVVVVVVLVLVLVLPPKR